MKGYIIGAGAQGHITAEIWRAAVPDIELLFFDDDPTLHGRDVTGIRVAGPVRSFIDASADDAGALIAVGNNLKRLEVAEACSWRRTPWAVIAHPSAVVMPSAEIGEGSIVMVQGLVNTAAVIGKHVIINSAAIVEHHSIIEDGASLGPGTSTGGRVHVGRGSFISAGVTIAPRIRIGAGTIVGAGAVVASDLPDGVLAYGVPARVVRQLEDSGDFSRVL